MALKFVFGRAGSGKSEYMIERAISAYSDKKRVIMIVPEQYSHKGETAFLQKKGFICDDLNVTSFNRLAKKIIKDSGINQKTLDDSGKAMLIYSAVNNCKNKLTFYNNTLSKQGFLTLFKDAISEFKKGQVTPEALRAAAKSSDKALFSARLFDLSYILEEYNKLLKDVYLDKDDILTLLAALMFESEYIKNSVVFIDEFYRFTQNEISCISSLMAMGNDVYVSLAIPDNNNYQNTIFKGVYDTKITLENAAKSVCSKVSEPIVLSDAPRFKSSELAFLERALSQATITPKSEPTVDISLRIAKNRYEEVLLCASSIREYVAKSGASFRDIAVICGDYEGYKDLVATIFPMYEIPVFSDTRHDFLSHPIVLYLFSLFDLVGSITTKNVISYMKSGFADIDDETVLKLENYALAGAIEYSDWLNDERFIRKAKSVFEKEDEENDESLLLLDAKNRLLSPILELKEKILESRALSSRIVSLKSFFEQTSLAQKIEEKITHFCNLGLLREADEFSEVYKILFETLDNMNDVLGSDSAGISSMRSILETGLSEKSIGVIPTVYDEISFGDLNRSVIKNTRALFVIGAVDGAFPPLPPSDTLLNDSEREFLISFGVSVAPETKKRIADSECSVYSALTSSAEKLFISYPVSKDDGSGMRPAMIISKLKRIFPSLTMVHELDKETPSPEHIVSSKQSAYTYVLTHIKNLSNNTLAKVLFDELKKDDDFKDKLERAYHFSNYENIAGHLTQNTVCDLYGKDLYGSVSRFERFSSCPFSFFVEYGLKAKERKILKVEAPDIGSLLHEIIERFSHTVKKSGESFATISREKQKDITDAIIEEMFGTMFIKNIYSAKRIDALKKRLKSLVAKSVWAICEHIKMGRFEPMGFELSFSQNGDLAPVTVPMKNGGTVTLVGRIDRIDSFSHEGKLYLKIIDYKSGNTKYSLSDIFNGIKLQLAVYTFVAIEEVAKTNGSDTAFGGMFYFHLDDPVINSMPDDANSYDSVLKSFKMSGLSPDNPDVIHAIDAQISGNSMVIPVFVKKDGEISKTSSKTATSEEFLRLTKYIKNTVSKIGEEIMSGDVDIYPVKNGSTLPCAYCKYRTICGFDPAIHPCRIAKEFDCDQDIWNEI